MRNIQRVPRANYQRIPHNLLNIQHRNFWILRKSFLCSLFIILVTSLIQLQIVNRVLIEFKLRFSMIWYRSVSFVCWIWAAAIFSINSFIFNKIWLVVLPWAIWFRFASDSLIISICSLNGLSLNFIDEICSGVKCLRIKSSTLFLSAELPNKLQQAEYALGKSLLVGLIKISSSPFCRVSLNCFTRSRYVDVLVTLRRGMKIDECSHSLSDDKNSFSWLSGLIFKILHRFSQNSIILLESLISDGKAARTEVA